MGTFRVRLDVGGAGREHFEPVDALVDTGASYTVLPSSLLRELGIAPHTRARFVLAGGREIERDLGIAGDELCRSPHSYMRIGSV